jgi:diguanylate cyclase (GGDEF)-like protein/PAS domain S-box-containing protein
MTQQYQNGLEQALQKCAEEPIHQLGTIQPHGVALVLSQSSNHTIIQASDNCAQLINSLPEQALGKTLAVVLGKTASIQVAQLIATAQQTNHYATGVIELSDQNQLDAHVYLADGTAVLELSNDVGLPKKEGVTDLLLQTQQLLLDCDSEKHLIDYLRQKAELVRSVTGYDNVMIYRFDENWDGQVIAQSCVDQAVDYLGTHFPASDIPPQARKIYTLNLVRIVTDINAEPIGFVPPLNPTTQLPLNMTCSILRSVSPIHLQYLRNMGTAATMTISLLQNGKLWGLIACHHFTPKRISLAMREIAHLFSRQISSKLTTYELYEQKYLRDKALDLTLHIMSLLSQDGTQLPFELLPELMSTVDANGIIVVVKGEITQYGQTPSYDKTKDLLDWLDQEIEQQPYSTNHLSSQYPDAHAYQDTVAGLLAIRLLTDMNNCIIWLRQEKKQAMKWAGVYENGLTQNRNGEYTLTPRKSFEIWSETWQGRSPAWTANEISSCQLVGNTLSQVLLNKTLNSQLINTAFSHSALLDLMPNGILITDKNRRITYVNSDFEKFTGYSKNELLGKSCALLQGPETDPKQVLAIRTALNNEQPFFGEIQNYDKDGTPFWNDLSINPIFDNENKLTQFVGIQRNVSDRKLLESNLRASEKRFRQLADGAPALIWQADIHNNRFWFNLGWLQFTGQSLEQAQGGGWKKSIHPEDYLAYLNNLNKHIELKEDYQLEYRLRRADGEYRWLECHGVPRYTERGEYEGFLGTCYDITEIRNSKAATDFFNISHEIIFTTDLNGIILDCNQRFCEVTGYARQYIIGHDTRTLKSGYHDKSFYATMWEKINTFGYWQGELINRHKDGSLLTLMTTISAVKDSTGNLHRYLAVQSDISSISHKRQQLEHLAYYDSLTGLPNRLLLQDRLAQSMTQAKRNNCIIAVIFIDLDGFKTINDNFGHQVGDEFLFLISKKLNNTIRESDTLARLAGDEFVIIYNNLETIKDVELPITNILQNINTPISLRNMTLRVSASVGVTFYPNEQDDDKQDTDHLLQCADQAMYIAKQNGKNCCHYFDSHIDQCIITRNTALKSIQNGLRNNEFELHYQPKVNMRSGKVFGVEGLIRWNNSATSQLLPAIFLPIIQNHPLSIELGYWVIDAALTQLNQWQTQGIELPISINIDAKQLHQSDFIDHLTKAIGNCPAFKPGLLEFEILETTALADREEAEDIINGCRQLGIEFALDDFGTGYSSITYLQKLPIQSIKLDRNFLVNITESASDVKIVSNLIRLVSDLGKPLIAEGVETIAQGQLLLELGCELAQGFAIAKPMPESTLIPWLRHWQTEPAWKSAPHTNKHYRLLFEQMSDPMLVIKDGCFIECNDAAVKFLGYPSKVDFLNQRPIDISPERQPCGRRSEDKAQEILKSALQEGVQCFEWLHYHADGSELLVEVMLTPIATNDEFIIHTVWRNLRYRR